MPEISGNRIVGVSVPMTVGHVVAADGEYSTEAVDPSSIGLVTEARLPTLAEELGIGDGGSDLPEGGQPGEVLTTGADGTAEWAPAPKGDAGRGIKSIVSSTSDPTKATVTYTDGATATLTLPSGAVGKSVKSFGTPDPTTGVSTVTFSDNTTTTITLPKGPKGDQGDPGAGWSKDQQAKVQGYWIVVSPTEPESPTYTTEDGTVVPVIWQKPIEMTVPVLPQTPSFSRASSSLTVPDLVGVVYRITGWSKDNGVTWTTVSEDLVGGAVTDVKTATGQELPLTVRVEALAKPGYVLPSPSSWTFDYPDPNATTILTSDTFTVDRTNAAATPTNAAMGGVPYTYDAQRAGVVLSGVAESGAFALKFGQTRNFEVVFDLVSRREDTRGPALTVSVATPRTDTSDAGARIYVDGDERGNMSRRYDGAKELKYSGWAGVSSVFGTWTITVVGDTFTIQPPNGGARETWTLTNTAMSNYGTTRGSNVAFGLGNCKIDNLVVKQVGL